VSIRATRSEIWLLTGFCFLAAIIGVLAGIDGRLALAGAFAIAFTLVAFTDLALGLALFTFLGFIVVVPNFAGQTLSVVKVAALPLLLSWLAIITREGNSRRIFTVVHPAISLLMALFLGWVVLSYTWAEDPSQTLASAFRYTLVIALVLVVFTAVQREAHVKAVVAAMVLGATAAALYGFLNPPPPQYGQVERLAGTLGNPNELAAALVLGIGLSGGLAAAVKDPLLRGAAIGAGGICLIAILLTGSRGGLIALGAMLLAAIVVAKGRRMALSLATCAVLLAGIAYVVMAAPPQSRERILHPGSGSGRVDIWTVGTRMVSANPVEGVGAGNFPVASIHYLLRPGAMTQDQYIADTPKVAENMYLEVFAELGIVGLAFFLTLIAFGLGCSFAALTRFRQLGRRHLQGLTAAIAVSTVGLLVADFFASEQYARELWLLLGLGPALLAIAKRMETDGGA
jgi:O-antigen ligase